jgi:ribitol 2-dehydrogenase
MLATHSIPEHIDICSAPLYSATKHAIQTWAHGVRRQVLPSRVRVMTLGPGMVANELWGIHDAETIAEHVRNRTALTSDDCAEAALFMLSRPPNVTIRDLVMLPQNQDL